MSSSDQHIIRYASPPHDSIGVVECSCGWVATRPLTEDQDYDILIKEMLGEWLEHLP
jgi:hypothetical protein